MHEIIAVQIYFITIDVDVDATKHSKQSKHTT